MDLYRSRLVSGKYTEAENLGDAINTEFDEFEAFIDPNEEFLIFMAGGRPDGLSGFDLFISITTKEMDEGTESGQTD